MRCGISRPAFLKFGSSLMIGAPLGLAITDMITPEAGRPKLAPLRPAWRWEKHNVQFADGPEG
jgi:hypothetical protein